LALDAPSHFAIGYSAEAKVALKFDDVRDSCVFCSKKILACTLALFE
jgi:hypothetical protein